MKKDRFAICLFQDEKVLGFTLDNKKWLGDFVGEVGSCVYWEDEAAVCSIQTALLSVQDVYVKKWKYPAGAFHGTEGGPC
jgi:hypothetical protein